jgi:origin recognition complex subunit 4
MDDSPRSSKRRKLTSIHETSSPLPKAPGRLTSRASSRRKAQVPDTEDEVVKPTPRSSKKRTVPSGKANEDEDVYDDIDGALPQPGQSRAPVRKPKTSPRKRTPKYVIDPTQPHPFKKSAPGAGFDFLIAKTGLSPSSAEFQTLVNGYRRELGMDSGALDELAVENGTPTKSRGSTKARGSAKKANGTPRSSVKKPSATPAKRGVRASQSLAEDGEEEDSADPLQASVATVSNPTRTRSSRKASARVQKSTIEETDDDEPIIATPSKSSNDRVHRHRNRDSPVVQAEEDQEIVIEDTKDGDGEDAMDVDGNSIVGSVLDPTEPSPFNKPSPVVQKQKITPLVQGSFESSRELHLLKTIVMERITGKRPAPLVGLEEEYNTVYQLVEHTITAGEGNSMLLIGARGSGKSALVNKVLTEISKDNNEDYHVVRLNGFIHTDDKIALREIWRQLGKEMDIEEDGGVGKNYADTLTTLLALLSHPDEQAGEFTDQVAKAVIFVMDEFDHFALHPRQTLLYNLFDIAQSRKAPIAVLGLTTRIDVANSLEKRVKSRFSHRYVHLSLAKTFTSFQDMCKSSLIIQADQLSVEERSILTSVPSNTPAKGRKAKSTTHDMLTTWNSNITVRLPTHYASARIQY